MNDKLSHWFLMWLAYLLFYAVYYPYRLFRANWLNNRLAIWAYGTTIYHEDWLTGRL